MMRLIDADELLKSPFRITGKLGGKYPFDAITVSMINSCPTIDPVHAAGRCYCGECKYLYRHRSGKLECGLLEYATSTGPALYVDPADFCSHGERKESNE